MNKKANIATGVILIIVVMFAVTVIGFIGKLMVDDLNADIQVDNSFNNLTKTTSSNIQSRYNSVFDAGFVLLFVLLWAAVLISAYLIDTSPVFFFASVIVLIIVTVFAIAVSSSYNEIVSDETFIDMPAYFPMTNYILSHLTMVVLIMGFSTAMVLYGKMR